jgi:hypothetical protein
MSCFTSGSVLSLTLLALSLGACSDSGGPSNQGRLNFNLATRVAPVAAAGASLAVVGTPETFTDGTNTLVIDQIQVVLREIELHRTGLASDCLNAIDDDCEELEIGPLLVDLPLGTPGASRTFSVEIAAGSYDKMEFEIHKPSSSDDAAFIQVNPGFQDVSIRVTGTYNGTGFTYLGDYNDELQFNMVPDLTVGATAVTELTLFADLNAWFRDQSGMLIDPATATTGSPNESLVEENIKNSLESFEDDDLDGDRD